MVYVDTVRNRYRRMVMCHMWADTLPELLRMADAIGVRRKWLQKPPDASWTHFDICLAKRKLAVAKGAVETDKYGALEFVAKQRGNTAMLATIRSLRKRARSKETPL